MSVIGQVSTYAILLMWSLICIFPFYWVVVSSIKPPMEFIENVSHYIPYFDFTPSLHAWRDIILNPDDHTLARFLNSFLIGTGATFLTVVTAALAAYGLTRFPISIPTGLGSRLRSEGIFGLLLVTRLLPPVVIVLPLYYIVQNVGLSDTRTALILTYTAVNLPVALWLLRAFLKEVPVELEEAAQLDGASHWRVLFTITLPIMRRGIVATSLLIFLLCWNEYLLSVYLTAQHALTMPPYLSLQMTSREQMSAAEPDDYARLAVVVILMVAPLLVFAGVLRRLVVGLGRRRWSNSRPN
jgi:multiple sugar transport system permease protein